MRRRDFQITTALSPKFTLNYRIRGYNFFRDLYHRAEPETWSLLLQELEPEGVIVDIGANIGQFSLICNLIVKERFGVSPEILAIEPSRNNFRLLKQNLTQNSCMRTKPLNVGVADVSERQKIEIHEVWNRKKSKRFIELIRLDDLSTEFQGKTIQLLKIDTDGFEFPILMGGQNFIKQYRPKILIELSPTTSAENDTSTQRIEETLLEMGYCKKGTFDGENTLFLFQ